MRFLSKAILAALLIGGYVAEALPHHRVRHTGPWTKKHRAHPTHEVTVGLVLKEQNLHVLNQLFWERTNPKSPLFAQWMTRDEIGELTQNQLASDYVESFLKKHGMRIIHKSKFGEYIKVKMPVTTAEELFQTEFHVYKSDQHKFDVIKTEQYTIPVDLSAHLQHIEHISYFPEKRSKMFSHVPHSGGLKFSNYTYPDLVFTTYDIPKDLKVTSPDATQSLFESIGQQYSPEDLAVFQRQFNLPMDKIVKEIGGNDPSACFRDSEACGEANLDVQYMMAVAQGASTWYWNAPADLEPFAEWLTSVNDIENPPLVHSISYGNYETDYPLSKLETFNTVAQKLALRGVSIVVSSGDDGAVNFRARNDSSKCGYFTSFPSSSPFITSIGATQGPEEGRPEIACSSRTGGLITTGGGFSQFFSVPEYQKNNVESYLSSIKSRIPEGYATGRGSPDVAALGHNYAIVVGGKFLLVSGTSASAPVFGGIITLINDHRINSGKKPLGFLNQALYQAEPSVWNDITQGDSFCAATHEPGTHCCAQGFYAAAGWDPLTGLGTPNFPKLKEYLGNL